MLVSTLVSLFFVLQVTEGVSCLKPKGPRPFPFLGQNHCEVSEEHFVLDFCFSHIINAPLNFSRKHNVTLPKRKQCLMGSSLLSALCRDKESRHQMA